jgi:hypothetical protein
MIYSQCLSCVVLYEANENMGRNYPQNHFTITVIFVRAMNKAEYTRIEDVISYEENGEKRIDTQSVAWEEKRLSVRNQYS